MGTRMKRQERTDYDGFWKDLVEHYLPNVIQRTLPELYKDVDFSRKPEFLSKELRDVITKPAALEQNAAYFTDELIRVYLKNGESQWVLLHIEIQGPGGEEISYRMTVYCCLIFAHHHEMPVALAILTAPRPREERRKGRLGVYQSSRYNTQLSYHYNCFEVYKQKDQDLLNSDNPFDLALYAAKKAALCGDKEEQKFKYLLDLTRLLAAKGWSEKERRDILIFIARIINLKDEGLQQQYVADVKGETNMAVETFIEKYFRDEGRAEGREEGRAEGRNEGRIEGAHQEQENFVVRMLKAGELTLKKIAEYSGLPLKEVRAIQKAMA